MEVAAGLDVYFEDDMKAVFFERLGGAEVLQYGDLPTPKPRRGEALIRVRACGLNHLDIWLRQRKDMVLPHIAGSDVSGVIEKINGLSTLRVGDEVIVNPAIPCGSCPRCKRGEACEKVKIFGAVTQGGYAEYVTVRVTQLYKKPKNLSFVKAAAFPLTFLTAWHMLVGRVGLRKGETVFVWGASGSLGTAAIQIARHLGAKVIAAARTDAAAQKIKKLGAHEAVVYRNGGVVEAVKKLTHGKGADVVFESVGEQTWSKSLAMLRPYGRVVIAGTTSGNNAMMDLGDLYARQLSIFGARMGTKDEFETVLELMNSGKLTPLIDSVFPLKDAAKAQERMEKGEHIGKIVLEVEQ